MVELSRVRQGDALARFRRFHGVVADAVYARHGAAVALVPHASRWLDREGLAPVDLDAEVVEKFFGDPRASSQTKYLSSRAAQPILAYLRAIGVVPAVRGRARAGWPRRPRGNFLARGLTVSLGGLLARLERIDIEPAAHQTGGGPGPKLRGIA